MCNAFISNLQFEASQVEICNYEWTRETSNAWAKTAEVRHNPGSPGLQKLQNWKSQTILDMYFCQVQGKSQTDKHLDTLYQKEKGSPTMQQMNTLSVWKQVQQMN